MRVFGPALAWAVCVWSRPDWFGVWAAVWVGKLGCGFRPGWIRLGFGTG